MEVRGLPERMRQREEQLFLVLTLVIGKFCCIVPLMISNLSFYIYGA